MDVTAQLAGPILQLCISRVLSESRQPFIQDPDLTQTDDSSWICSRLKSLLEAPAMGLCLANSAMRCLGKITDNI